ncbi:MAG TPA: flagellar biosynthesis anti-sigma factor FlgM [Blastocatellia bacterium]|nr:flagellar biosynthesis anti-sigma factor FlgM [Blastocatellia bacterium]
MDSDRAKRVERLREAVASGTYHVDSDTIARRVLEAWAASDRNPA